MEPYRREYRDIEDYLRTEIDEKYGTEDGEGYMVPV